jgi:hypothetical protein
LQVIKFYHPEPGIYISKIKVPPAAETGLPRA